MCSQVENLGVEEGGQVTSSASVDIDLKWSRIHVSIILTFVAPFVPNMTRD